MLRNKLSYLIASCLMATAAHAVASDLAASGSDDGMPSGSSLQAAQPDYENGTGIIGGRVDQRQIEEARPLVEVNEAGLFVSAPKIMSMNVMIVRVYNDMGELVLNVRSYGEPVDLMAANLPKGEYHYETITLFELDNAIGEGADYQHEGSSRNAGTFSVGKGEIIELNQREEASLIDHVLEKAMNLAGATLDLLIPSASANETITGSPPYLYFDDSASVGTDWAVIGEGFFDYYRVTDQLGTNNHAVFEIRGDQSSTLNSNSMMVDSDGDIHWANNGLNFDRGAQTLSLGWISTVADISISDFNPDIRLHDTTNTAEVELQLDSSLFRLYGRPTDVALFNSIFTIDVNAPSDTLLVNSGGFITLGGSINTAGSILTLGNPGSSRAQMQFTDDGGDAYLEWGQSANKLQFENGATTTVIEYDLSAPSGSMVLQSTGSLGLGTFNPAAPIHIARSDGTAGLMISETNGTAGNRNLMTLVNNGGPQIRFSDTTRPYSWDFIAGRDFKMNATGNAGTEFVVERTGNAFLLGVLTENSDVNSKQDIEQVNGYEVLEKLSTLPISEWSYKDSPADRHIGPMAQDFHAAFGLGHSDTGLATLDSSGVALAAIKALIEENATLKDRLSLLEREQSELQAVVFEILENQSEQRVLTSTVQN